VVRCRCITFPKRGFKSHLLKFNAEVTLTHWRSGADVDLLILKKAGLVGQLAKKCQGRENELSNGCQTEWYCSNCCCQISGSKPLAVRQVA
jgi:hypothetical protein